jgi:phosphomannomutase/phosphoglucomutase
MLQIERRIAKGVAAVATFDQNIFRAYDIRGNTQSSLTPSVAKLVGLAFGSYLKKFNEHTAVVGRDNRYSSPELQKALCDGILATGSNVIDIGQVITPVFYYAQKLFGIGSGVMVTGSHNPPEDNGFKITVGGNTLFEEQIQELKNIILNVKSECG